MTVAVTKGEFARIIGVSPGRVSQYLTEGKISAAALEGSGRSAKIKVEQARADLRLTLDVSQRLGNGIDTRLDSDEQAPTVAVPTSEPITVPAEIIRGPDHEIKLQKLEQLRRANRAGAIAEAKNSGLLMETAEARAQMSRIAAAMLDVFEGGLNDMASAIAAQFELPQRDVKHLMKAEFRKVRESAARKMKEKAVELDEVTKTGLDAEEADAAELAD